MAKTVVDSAHNYNRNKITCLQLNNQAKFNETQRSTATAKDYMSTKIYDILDIICKL